MSQSFSRILGPLLVLCLVFDPGTATAYTSLETPLHRTAFHSTVPPDCLQTEALTSMGLWLRDVWGSHRLVNETRHQADLFRAEETPILVSLSMAIQVPVMNRLTHSLATPPNGGAPAHSWVASAVMVAAAALPYFMMAA